MKINLPILEDLAIALNIDSDDVEAHVIDYYLALRLQPLITSAGIPARKINKLIDDFAAMYFIDNYSLDILINAVYNYINTTNELPPDNLLNDNIETFLETYGQL